MTFAVSGMDIKVWKALLWNTLGRKVEVGWITKHNSKIWKTVRAGWKVCGLYYTVLSTIVWWIQYKSLASSHLVLIDPLLLKVNSPIKSQFFPHIKSQFIQIRCPIFIVHHTMMYLLNILVKYSLNWLERKINTTHFKKCILIGSSMCKSHKKCR